MWEKNKFKPTIMTMTGSHQFFHAMVPHENPIGKPIVQPANDLKIDIVDQILRWFDAARRAKDPEEQGFQLGKAIHTVEDSYCPSHVWRDATGKIIEFEDYGARGSQAPRPSGRLDGVDGHGRNREMGKC